MRFEHLCWQDTEALRCRVLGWERGPVPGDSDEGVLHLGAFDQDGRLVAVGSTVERECPDRPGVPALYLWAMAVDPQYQRRGVGTQLMERLRSIARNRGVELLWADARESALGFYAKCGATVGESPTSTKSRVCRTGGS